MRYWHPRARPRSSPSSSARASNMSSCCRSTPNTHSLPAAVPITNFNANARASYRPQIAYIRQWFEQPDYQRAIVETCGARRRRFPILTRRASGCCSPPTACRARSPTAAILTSNISARPTTRCADMLLVRSPRSSPCEPWAKNSHLDTRQRPNRENTTAPRCKTFDDICADNPAAGGQLLPDAA